MTRGSRPASNLRRRGDLAGRHEGELVEQVLRVRHDAGDCPADAADGPGAADREVEVRRDPAGHRHLAGADVPSFRGADRDRYPMQLLQAMAASGLFEDWRVAEAGVVWWNYQGPGGAYDYWPDGLDGPMRSEHPPFINSALVADNNRMYHRIGWIGDPAAAAPAFSAAAQISHHADGGWTIGDTGRAPVRYDDRDIRISILWKAQVSPGPESDAAAPLIPELIAGIISADLTRRGVQARGQMPSLSDQGWLDMVHSTYYVPMSTATP